MIQLARMAIAGLCWGH